MTASTCCGVRRRTESSRVPGGAFSTPATLAGLDIVADEPCSCVPLRVCGRAGLSSARFALPHIHRAALL